MTATFVRSSSVRPTGGRSSGEASEGSAATACLSARSEMAPSSSVTARAPSSQPEAYGSPFPPGALRPAAPISSYARASAPASTKPISSSASPDQTPARASSCSSVLFALRTLVSSSCCRPSPAVLTGSSSA
ncbi:hypothetical protein STANM309S_04453 [Streptomyces tanashiensis]